MKWHVEARPRVFTRRTQSIGAVIDAEDVTHALMWLQRAIDRQAFADEAMIPLHTLPGLTITVERTDKQENE